MLVESSSDDKDGQGDAAVNQSADAIQKCLNLSESEPGPPNTQGKESNQFGKSSQNKEDTVRTSQPSLDQNADVDKAKQSRKKGKNEQKQQQKESPAPKQNMIFGPQKKVDLIKIWIF